MEHKKDNSLNKLIDIETINNDILLAQQEYLSSFSERGTDELESFYSIWDYVEMTTISDEFWEKNYEAIKLMTFDLWRHYSMSIEERDDLDLIKFQGKMLEIIFSTLMKHGIIKGK